MKAALTEICTGIRAQRIEKSKNQSLHPIQVSICLSWIYIHVYMYVSCFYEYIYIYNFILPYLCIYLLRYLLIYIGTLLVLYFFYTNVLFKLFGIVCFVGIRWWWHKFWKSIFSYQCRYVTSSRPWSFKTLVHILRSIAKEISSQILTKLDNRLYLIKDIRRFYQFRLLCINSGGFFGSNANFAACEYSSVMQVISII